MDFQHLRSFDSLPSDSGFSYLNLEPRRRVEEQDLLSRFEECSRKNKDLNVDCTLQLGLHSNSKPTSTNDHTHGSLQGYNIPDGRWKTVPVIHTNGALAYTGGGSSSMASSSSSSVYPEYKMYPAFYHFQNTIATTINQHKTPEITGRKCAICLTTSTPLWRNGPGGSKTLCNACGIRYKKEEKRVRLAESRDNRMKMG